MRQKDLTHPPIPSPDFTKLKKSSTRQTLTNTQIDIRSKVRMSVVKKMDRGAMRAKSGSPL